LVAIVFGQLLMALVIDHLGLFSSPQISATWPRVLGVMLVAAGAVLVSW
jgi:transporter family-2 protein